MGECELQLGWIAYPAPRIVILAILRACTIIHLNVAQNRESKLGFVYMYNRWWLRDRKSCHRLSPGVGFAACGPTDCGEHHHDS